jgi:hypothetical protein
VSLKVGNASDRPHAARYLFLNLTGRRPSRPRREVDIVFNPSVLDFWGETQAARGLIGTICPTLSAKSEFTETNNWRLTSGPSYEVFRAVDGSRGFRHACRAALASRSRRPADGLAGSVAHARTPGAGAGLRDDPLLLVGQVSRFAPPSAVRNWARGHVPNRNLGNRNLYRSSVSVTRRGIPESACV